MRPATETSRVVSHNGKTIPRWRTAPPFWKSIYRHISVKNHPISIKFCTQQQILNWMNVTWSKMKKLHWTDSEFNSTYFLCFITPNQQTFGISCIDTVSCVQKKHPLFTRHSLVRAKGEVLVLLYVFFCSLFCQRFLDNARADSSQILHADVLWFRMCLLPFWGLAAPGGWKKEEMKFSLL